MHTLRILGIVLVLAFLTIMLSMGFASSTVTGNLVATPTPEPIMVWPTLESLQPPQTAPGYEILITGSGGYWFFPPGGYIESYRTFELYFDSQALSTIACYGGYCQGNLVVPPDAAFGTHSVSTEGGSTLSLTVVEESKLYIPLVRVSSENGITKRN